MLIQTNFNKNKIDTFIIKNKQQCKLPKLGCISDDFHLSNYIINPLPKINEDQLRFQIFIKLGDNFYF